jgi:hypothetical protein
MNRTIVTFLKTVSAVGALGAVCLASGHASAQYVYPPAEYIATTEPVYYEGRAAYWYGDRWYYRTGNGWDYYRGEPGYLRDYRGRYYGHGYYGRRFYGGGWHRR